MENYRDFQGKDLDECISRAIDYFGCPRTKLEIEIVQDAKSGIFGIVGARKAKIRARRIHVQEAVANLLAPEPAQECPPAPPVPSDKGEVERSLPPRKPTLKNKKVRKEGENPGHQPAARQEAISSPDMTAESPDNHEDSWPYRPWEELDHSLIKEKLGEIIQTLASKIVGKEVRVRIDLTQGKPRAIIDWKGDAGIIIGREGQTLGSLQYLASRMLSHAIGANLRVQLDIGNYRMRQDDNLREMAKSLATRVRQSGKPLSTRPLSSYHRRVIHVCLQPDPDVQTRSIGEGPLKRVLISPKRSCLPL